MAWERVGIERPIEDENGKRPENDENGPRPREEVPYAPLQDLEFEIDPMTEVGDRRWIESVLDNLQSGGRAISVSYAVDFEATMTAACQRLIRGIRIEGSEEAKGEAAARILASALEYNHAVVLLSWLHRKARLEGAKKKNWRRLFGLAT